MSPRRSSRARATQPPQSAAQQTNSSTSSISSGRAERSVRSNHKLPSPQSSTAPRSRSSQEVDDSAKPPPIRRTRSSQDDTKDDIKVTQEDEEDEEGEEEITRCICGHLEYPGMPVPVGDSPKVNSKGNGVPDPSAAPTTLPEDSGGLFIQCDVCKVWQHGGCVGIMDEAMSPEEYFCEQCRKDLHKITTTANGQRYSCYLPVQGPKSNQPSPTPAPHYDFSKRSKEGRTSRETAESIASKRRSTMNSRDAAYDETEQLRRAIEESKKEGGAPSASTSTRRGKRSRSDSEQRKEDTKRQRTGSNASSPPSESRTLLPNPYSEDEADKSGPRKVRGVVARNHREKEIRDREEKRERERADAAGRRKGRAERRRGDESDLSEEPLSRTISKAAESSIPIITPHPPPPRSPPIPKPSHHKKTGRPPARRGRIGRNQYTKDRDPRPSDPMHPSSTNSPLRSQSHSRDAAHSPRHLSNGHGNTNTQSNMNDWSVTENGKPSKPRHMNPNRTTMNDMKRRVSGILDFISRTQVEMATSNGMSNEDPAITTGSSSRTRTRTHSTVGVGINGGLTDTESSGGLTRNNNGDVDGGKGTTGLDVDGFASLSSVEMMEALTRGLMRWQGEFGKVGEK